MILDRILPELHIPVAELGRAGERRAIWFYRLRGYRLVDRNVRFRDGEIDLIVCRRNELVFVEVKTRQQRNHGEGFDAVDRKKQLQVARLAEIYLDARGLRPMRVRFDVVSLFWNGRRFEVTHFGDAFTLEADPRYPWKNK